jgi:outer membrane PBP1 activator LpoA protein
VKDVTENALLKELGGAIRDKDQGRAAALTARLGAAKADPAAAFAVLRDFAVSEDGALHAEKYYKTTSDEFAMSRPAFRWRQIVALARVTASAYGYPAPGFKDSCEILKTG